MTWWIFSWLAGSLLIPRFALSMSIMHLGPVSPTWSLSGWCQSKKKKKRVRKLKQKQQKQGDKLGLGLSPLITTALLQGNIMRYITRHCSGFFFKLNKAKKKKTVFSILYIFLSFVTLMDVDLFVMKFSTLVSLRCSIYTESCVYYPVQSLDQSNNMEGSCKMQKLESFPLAEFSSEAQF